MSQDNMPVSEGQAAATSSGTVATPENRGADFQTYDYVTPGFAVPDVRSHFPHMIEGDRQLNEWDYLRREIPHTWYTDERSPIMGFVSTDEATILHNTARAFAGKKAIEIGCWRGWSTAHIASAGVVLDVVDPILHDAEIKGEIETMLQGIGATERVALHPGTSPGAVRQLMVEDFAPYSFAFIDGDHEQDAPTLDAATVIDLMADDAVVLFHDLSSPHVAAGLRYLRSKGWNTMVFQTMQIMGVAWRGDVTIPDHVPDPNVQWEIPTHLESFDISGDTDAEKLARFKAAAVNRDDVQLKLRAAESSIFMMAADKMMRADQAEAWIQAEREAAANWKNFASNAISTVKRGFPLG